MRRQPPPWLTNLGRWFYLSSRATVFLLDDTQLINEAFLEDVNGILNTGEVPSLFNNEEMVAINESLTKPAQVLWPPHSVLR